MSQRKLRLLPGGKMSPEERKQRLALLRSQAKDLDCLRNEMEGIAPGEEHELSEASLRALLRIRRKLERELED
ncbi:MAG TPA: hypothetical protein PLM29_00745 [Deltaproteobacteria bacterium]|nr:hypothetical protein [Deltaproteobacteria bacterium]HPR53156.1 hypothetical protein [Deltaproteobacteria bacterium]